MLLHARPYSKQILIPVALCVLLIFTPEDIHAQPPPLPSQATAAEGLVGQGVAAATRGDYKAALDYFSRAISLNPKNADAYYQRGLVLSEVNWSGLTLPSSPIKDFEQAIQLNPEFAEAYLQHALHYGARAIADLNRAIQINPDYAEAYYHRGLTLAGSAYSRLYNQTKKSSYGEALNQNAPALREAIDDFTKAISLKPDSAENYLERGYAYFELKEYQGSINDLTRVIQFQPDDYQAYYQRCLARLGVKDYPRALDDVSQAIKLLADEGEMYDVRGWVRYRLGDEEGALEDYTRAIRLGPKVVYFLPRDYHGKPGNADASYKPVTAMFPELLRTVRNKERLAELFYEEARRMHFSLGWDVKGIVGAYTQAIQLRPKFVDAYYSRGLFYLAASKLSDENTGPKAIEDFTEALKLNPENVDIYFSRGLTYSGLGDKRKAISDLEQVARINPKLTRVYYEKGLIYLESGELQKAVDEFSSYIAQDPEYPEAYFHRGRAYELLGERKKALADYQRVASQGGGPFFANSLLKGVPDEDASAPYYRGIARLALAGTPHAAEGAVSKAVDDFTEAIRLRPRLVEAYYQRGRARRSLNRSESYQGGNADTNLVKLALKDFDRAIQLKPEFAEAYAEAALLHADSGEVKRAIKELTQAAALEPGWADPYFHLAQIYSRGNAERGADNESAIANYTRAIQLNPNLVEAYRQRADLLLRVKNDKQSAIEDYTQVIRIDPEDAVAYRERGDLRFELHDYRGAIADYTNAIELAPAAPDSEDADAARTYRMRGLARYEIGDGRGAVQDVNEARRIKPCGSCASGSPTLSRANNAESFLRLGLILSRKGDKTGARKKLEQAAQLFHAEGKMNEYRQARYELGKL